MSDLKFKDAFKLSYHEMIDYINELETRVKNADSGARLFKDEAQLTRTEVLKWKEIAGQNDDRYVEMSLFFERHIEALFALADNGYESSIEQSDFVTIVRLLRYMLRGVLVNFRKEFMGVDNDSERPEDWSDIPF